MKFEKTKVFNFDGAIRGMRNPYNSWDKSDSKWVLNEKDATEYFVIGEKDKDLAVSLIKGGSEHRKFLRQIFVCVDISAPLYWWKEFVTYRVGVISNSCSTMHTITKYKFNLDMFEHDSTRKNQVSILSNVIKELNKLREEYLQTKDKNTWKDIIVTLPDSFIQKRTITMTYENLLAMCSKGQRRFHKLTEWSTDFINWARSLPYAQEFIFTDELDKNKE